MIDMASQLFRLLDFYRRLFVRLPHCLWSIGWPTYWITDWL